MSTSNSAVTQALSTTTRALGAAAATTALVAAPLAMSTTHAHAASGNWDAVASCESGGNWGADTGNGYYGGLQISAETWNANGGSGLPHHSSREGQIGVAESILASQGAGAWPTCGANL